jgi:hypothetical protein
VWGLKLSETRDFGRLRVPVCRIPTLTERAHAAFPPRGGPRSATVKQRVDWNRKWTRRRTLRRRLACARWRGLGSFAADRMTLERLPPCRHAPGSLDPTYPAPNGAVDARGSASSSRSCPANPSQPHCCRDSHSRWPRSLSRVRCVVFVGASGAQKRPHTYRVTPYEPLEPRRAFHHHCFQVTVDLDVKVRQRTLRAVSPKAKESTREDEPVGLTVGTFVGCGRGRPC